VHSRVTRASSTCEAAHSTCGPSARVAECTKTTPRVWVPLMSGLLIRVTRDVFPNDLVLSHQRPRTRIAAQRQSECRSERHCASVQVGAWCRCDGWDASD